MLLKRKRQGMSWNPLMAVFLVVSVAGCTEIVQNQHAAMSGGAIGAGAGALLSAAFSGSAAIGAVIGAGSGAVIAALAD